MLRLALLGLLLVVGALVLIARLPDAGAVVPDSRIILSGAVITLYPKADPEAIWYFSAPTVEYDPLSQETTLLDIDDGRRTVHSETDFTLDSDSVTIDRSDNIRGARMRAHLIEDEIDLDMSGRGDRLVLIDQAAGRFEVPRAVMTGPDLGESVFEDMRISFDFTDFQSGGPGTVGYSEFIIRSGEGAQ